MYTCIRQAYATLTVFFEYLLETTRAQVAGFSRLDHDESIPESNTAIREDLNSSN